MIKEKVKTIKGNIEGSPQWWPTITWRIHAMEVNWLDC